MARSLFITVILAVFIGTTTAATFYVDPENGNDDAAGTAGAPWKTLANSLTTGAGKAASTEDITVILRGGHYGNLELTGVDGAGKAATGTWTTYRAAAGETPVFGSMVIKGQGRAPVNLRFDGIHVLPGSGKAAAKAAIVPTDPISIGGVSNLIYENGRIWGTTWETNAGLVWIEDCSNITLRRNEIGNGAYGLKYIDCDSCQALFNHIHSLSSSGIKYMMGNKDCVLAGNHIHDQQTYDGSHASAISIRSGDVMIRGNILHDGFTSSGMMLYDSDGSTSYYFSNITMENNLMYDITNMYCLRLYNMVSNIVIRNNTFIAHKKDTPDARYAMETAISGGTEVSRIYNNIFIGTAFLGTAPAFNNIMWSCTATDGWTCTLNNNIIKVCGYFDTEPFSYFESGFFSGTPNLEPAHEQTIDYRLAEGSPAINFGDASQQPSSSLGTLDENGFIQENGLARDAEHHSAGAYEFDTSTGVDGFFMNPRMIISNLSATDRFDKVYNLEGRQIHMPERTKGVLLGLDADGNSVKIINVR